MIALVLLEGRRRRIGIPKRVEIAGTFATPHNAIFEETPKIKAARVGRVQLTPSLTLIAGDRRTLGDDVRQPDFRG